MGKHHLYYHQPNHHHLYTVCANVILYYPHHLDIFCANIIFTIIRHIIIICSLFVQMSSSTTHISSTLLCKHHLYIITIIAAIIPTSLSVSLHTHICEPPSTPCESRHWLQFLCW